jgi:hypothetical protein
MIKYIVFSLLFLLKIGFLFGQNTDSLFHVITKKHENVPYYTIIKENISIWKEGKSIIHTYQFVQRKHKEKTFAFFVLSEENSSMTYSVRYYASRNKTDKVFTIINRDEDYFWYNIELLDLNNDNIREIALNYENGYPCNYKEIYNFSTDSIAPIILKDHYDNGILVCIDTTKNLYLKIERTNGRGMWESELFVINKDFSKGKVIGTARWDSGNICDNCFDISGKHKENPYTTYFYSNSYSVIYNFHPHVDNWNSKENIEFMKNAYLKMIEEFDIEY